MQCIRPLKAGFDAAGNIVYSAKKITNELVAFQFECRKCLPCRLNQGREKAVRAYHESQMHLDNIFLTLTYKDPLESPWLRYNHFQKFIQDLRDHVGHQPHQKIPYMVTGEYGDKTKRPHWHALLFNYIPPDGKPKYTTDLGHKVQTSKLIEEIWSHGNTEYGDLTLESASYVARYAAKKLAHGNDQNHPYQPIHKTSSKYALGRSWIEKHYEHTFNHGFVILPNGEKSKIPRYYVDWAKKHRWDTYLHYVTETLPKIIELTQTKQRSEELNYLSNILSYSGGARYPNHPSNVKHTILNQKFKNLQEKLKL